MPRRPSTSRLRNVCVSASIQWRFSKTRRSGRSRLCQTRIRRTPSRVGLAALLGSSAAHAGSSTGTSSSQSTAGSTSARDASSADEARGHLRADVGGVGAIVDLEVACAAGRRPASTRSSGRTRRSPSRARASRAARDERTSSWKSRDFPTPGSPMTATTWPCARLRAIECLLEELELVRTPHETRETAGSRRLEARSGGLGRHQLEHVDGLGQSLDGDEARAA